MALKMTKTAKAADDDTAPIGKVPAWMKRGKAAQQEMEKYEKDAEKHWAEKNRLWRFFLKKGETAKVTFVDGNLGPDGTLDLLTFREHTVKVNGDWTNYVCIAENEPCPICEGGDFPALVGVLTVIDHRTYKGAKGVYKDQPRLFVAKKGTIKQLQQMATKREGLAGCTYEISRLNDQDPNVGGSFEFEEKNSIEKLQKTFTRKGKDGKTSTVFVPANYEREIVYLTAQELRNQGFGSSKSIGSEKKVHDTEPAGDEAGAHM